MSIDQEPTTTWTPPSDDPPPTAHFVLTRRQLGGILGYPETDPHSTRMWVEPDGGYLHVLLADSRPGGVAWEGRPFYRVAEGGYVEIARSDDGFWSDFTIVVRRTAVRPSRYVWELCRGSHVLVTGEEKLSEPEAMAEWASKLFPLVGRFLVEQ